MLCMLYWIPIEHKIDTLLIRHNNYGIITKLIPTISGHCNFHINVEVVKTLKGNLKSFLFSLGLLSKEMKSHF